MTAFSFIHAADLHLGSPLAGLAARDADLARRLASASRQAFEDLVSQASERSVAFVVVAGDVYDGDWADTTIGLFFARQVARLDRAGIPTILVRGNHDAESVITRSITLPASVHFFPTARAGTLRLDALRVAPEDALMVGDSLPTDIRGANAAGLDSLLVMDGLHAEEFGLQAGKAADPARVEAAAAKLGVKPTGVLRQFAW